MICPRGLLYVIEWLIVMDQATAYMSGCFEGLCFISSPPRYNTLLWTSADQWCRDNGTQLIAITNRGVQNATSRFLNDNRSKYNYNGGSLFTNGIRKAGIWTWLNGNSASYPWIDPPYDLSYAYRYLQLTSSGITIDASRPEEMKQGYICQNESQCTSTTGVVLNFRCYSSYNNETLSWFDARNRCVDRGGDLASFDFINDKQGLNVLNGTWLRQGTDYLVGLRRERWTWQGTQADVKYSTWSRGHPHTYPTDPFDCLCLEPSQWNWVECRCGDPKPFICMSGELRYSSTTKTTTTTASTIKPTPNLNTLMPTSTIVSNNSIDDVVNGINGQHSSENTMSTAFDSSTTSAVGVESKKQRENLDTQMAIGIGVGVGGGVLVVATAVIIAIVVIRKRSQRSDPEKKDKAKEAKKLQPPDIIAQQTMSKQEESPYGTVVRLPDFADTIDYDNAPSDTPQTVYANLEILTKSSSDDNSPDVANDIESSRPSSPSRLTEADVEIDHVEMNSEQYAAVTP